MIEHEVQDSDNSKEDEDLLDIKPPQTSNTTSGFHHKEKKKKENIQKHTNPVREITTKAIMTELAIETRSHGSLFL